MFPTPTILSLASPASSLEKLPTPMVPLKTSMVTNPHRVMILKFLQVLFNFLPLDIPKDLPFKAPLVEGRTLLLLSLITHSSMSILYYIYDYYLILREMNKSKEDSCLPTQHNTTKMRDLGNLSPKINMWLFIEIKKPKP